MNDQTSEPVRPARRIDKYQALIMIRDLIIEAMGYWWRVPLILQMIAAHAHLRVCMNGNPAT